MQAHVAALAVYPLKGAAGIPLDAAEVRITGLASHGIADREWMAVDRDGVFVTQREHPRLALVRTAIDDGRVVLSASGMAPLALDANHHAGSRAVRVWNANVRGFDAGDGAADWVSAAIGTPVRLARFDPSHPRRCNPQYAGDSGAEVHFADGYPLLVIGRASLDELNARLAANGAAPVGMDRFRPSLVLEGLAPHDEDHLATIAIDGVVLKPVKPCTRCQVTTVDQATARMGAEPLVTLASYRRDDRLAGITFGMNAIVIAGAGRAIARGATASCEWAF
ncbi:MAG: MOSC N-terminal beta barrel domain-containing protein [Betaproteobacteria bacterium]